MYKTPPFNNILSLSLPIFPNESLLFYLSADNGHIPRVFFPGAPAKGRPRIAGKTPRADEDIGPYGVRRETAGGWYLSLRGAAKTGGRMISAPTGCGGKRRADGIRPYGGARESAGG